MSSSDAPEMLSRVPRIGWAKRMAVEDHLGQHVVDEVLGRILHHGDLLQHHFALAIEVGEGGGEEHVGHHVQRHRQLVVQEAPVDDHVLPRGAGVQLPPKGVEDLGDLFRRELRRPLEEEVLYEMSGADERIGLIAGTGRDPEAQTHRAQVIELLGYQPLPVGELLQTILVSRHCLPLRTGSPAGAD